MSCNIPIMPTTWPAVNREAPITPRENLMLAFDHKKPMYMPNLYYDSQFVACKSNHDMAPTKSAAGVDWFGTNYAFSPECGINMPVGGVLNDVTEWRDKIKWPDLKNMDWSRDAEGFVRDESRALYTRFSNGIFERLHGFEGFEQCLMDLLLEPDECRDLFDRLADYKIDLFDRYLDAFPLDYLVAADDYGTAKAPFFSTAMFEDLLLEPTRRFVKHVQSRGVKFFAHCCGKVDDFIPYFVDELGVDGVELQPLNDLPGIVNKYGDKLLVEVQPDPQIVFDDEMTDEQLIAHIRDLVDTYGAQSNPGSGAVMNLKSGWERTYKLMEEEMYQYSSKKYQQA